MRFGNLKPDGLETENNSRPCTFEENEAEQQIKPKLIYFVEHQRCTILGKRKR